MVTKLTASQENYLELILGLSQHGPVRISQIATMAGVRLPSVTKAVCKLVEAGLVRHETYGKVEITPSGMEAARSVVRRDDCLTRLLTEVLCLPEGQVEVEVCRLEHLISHSVLLRLETLVEYACDDKSGNWLKGLQKKLNKLSPEKKAILVGDNNPHVAAGKTHRKQTKKARRKI